MQAIKVIFHWRPSSERIVLANFMVLNAVAITKGTAQLTASVRRKSGTRPRVWMRVTHKNRRVINISSGLLFFTYSTLFESKPDFEAGWDFR